MDYAYLDTSYILCHLLNQRIDRNITDQIRKIAHVFSSTLLRVETFRALDKMRIIDRWSSEEISDKIQEYNDLTEGMDEIPLQPAILKRATEAFPTVVKTLDALHISTALLMQSSVASPVIFVTHDKQQAQAAKAVGLIIL